MNYKNTSLLIKTIFPDLYARLFISSGHVLLFPIRSCLLLNNVELGKYCQQLHLGSLIQLKSLLPHKSWRHVTHLLTATHKLNSSVSSLDQVVVLRLFGQMLSKSIHVETDLFLLFFLDSRLENTYILRKYERNSIMEREWSIVSKQNSLRPKPQITLWVIKQPTCSLRSLLHSCKKDGLSCVSVRLWSTRKYPGI